MVTNLPTYYKRRTEIRGLDENIVSITIQPTSDIKVAMKIKFEIWNNHIIATSINYSARKTEKKFTKTLILTLLLNIRKIIHSLKSSLLNNDWLSVSVTNSCIIKLKK